MAKGFNDTKGEAQKGGEWYKWVDGEQTLRLVGDIVPRYVYWKTAPDGNNISIECLAFDRDKEKFTRVEKDWFAEFFPDQKCSWAYVVRAINPTDPKKTILIPMKKKLYQQIQETAVDLGDPTDLDNGWDAVITRAKTGSQAFNVEYTLKALRCKTRALTDEERETVANMPDIDTLVPRPTPEEQKEYIQQVFFGSGESDNDAVNDLDSPDKPEFDDIPF